MPALEYPHILKTTGTVARLERIPRIRVAQIVADHLGYGWSAEEILRQHPNLKPAEIHAALAYYFDHRDEIDTELATELAAMAPTESASPLRLRLLSARHSAK